MAQKIKMLKKEKRQSSQSPKVVDKSIHMQAKIFNNES